METVRAHPKPVVRADFFMRGIYLGVRALCRRVGADWDGPDVPPDNQDWIEDLISLAMLKSARRRTVAEDLRDMLDEES